MEIKNNYAVNFGNKRLFSAVLKQKNALGKFQDIDVFISELELGDRFAVEELFKRWKDTSFGPSVIASFLDATSGKTQEINKVKKYFVIEAANKNFPNNTCGLAVTRVYNEDVFVPMLQAYPYGKKFKGIGSALMFAITKYAHLKNKSVCLYPTTEAEEFYKKLGFKALRPNDFEFILDKSSFPQLEKALEGKYSIKPLDFKA